MSRWTMAMTLLVTMASVGCARRSVPTPAPVLAVEVEEPAMCTAEAPPPPVVTRRGGIGRCATN